MLVNFDMWSELFYFNEKRVKKNFLNIIQDYFISIFSWTIFLFSISCLSNIYITLYGFRCMRYLCILLSWWHHICRLSFSWSLAYRQSWNMEHKLVSRRHLVRLLSSRLDLSWITISCWTLMGCVIMSNRGLCNHWTFRICMEDHQSFR